MEAIGYGLMGASIFLTLVVGWSWLSLWKLDSPKLYFGGWIIFLFIAGLIFISLGK